MPWHAAFRRRIQCNGNALVELIHTPDQRGYEDKHIDQHIWEQVGNAGDRERLGNNRYEREVAP